MDIRLIFLNYLVIVIRCGGTQEDRRAPDWMWAFKRVPSLYRKIRTSDKKGGVNRRVYGPEDAESALSRKASLIENNI